MYGNIDNKRISLISLCDLSKAFGSVSHEILINKCIKLKVDAEWFRSYLRKKTQAVRIGNVVSSKADTSYGVPQGSVLRPILCIIYVNDLVRYITNCQIILYADHTQFIHTDCIDSIQELIRIGEETLAKAKIYFHANGLMLNTMFVHCNTQSFISDP